MTRSAALLVAGALLLLPACQKREAAPAARLAPAAAVAARVEGQPITADDVAREAAAQGLVAPGASLPRTDPAFDRLVAELVNQRLLAAEAERRKLTDDPAVAAAVAAARERALADALVAAEVAKAATEAQVRALHQEQVRALAQAGDAAPPTLEQARPQIVRFLTYDEVRGLLETLRGRAKIEIVPPAPPPGAPPAVPALRPAAQVPEPKA